MVDTASEQRASGTSAKRAGRGDLVPNLVSALAVVASFVGYLVANHSLWFFGDDWDFLLNRSLTHNTLHNLLAPHNEHWSTIPVLSYRLLYSMFGLHHYLVYVVPVLLLHAGSCVLLWVLMRRAGASPWATAGGVVLVAVCGGGAENLGWDFQIGFVGSVFFGLLAVLIADAQTFSRSRLIWVWIVLVLSLMSSGIGVPMVVATAVFVLLKRGWRTGLAVASVPIAVFVLWYATYGHKGTTGDKTTLSDRLKSAQYIWQGLTNTWQDNTQIPNAGALILVAMSLPVLIFGLRDRLGRLAMALLAGEVGLFALTGWSRVHLGVNQADASRYVYISTMLTIVAAVWSTTALVRLTRERVPEHRPVPIVVTVVLAVLLTLVAMGADAHNFFSSRKKLAIAGEKSILAAAQLIREGVPLVGCCPDHKFNPDATVAQLSRPGVLSQLPRYPLSPAQDITSRGLLQVAVRNGSHVLAMSGTVTMSSTAQVLTNGVPSCAVGTADSDHPVLVLEQSGRATVTVSTTGPVFTQLQYNGMTSPVSTWTVPNTPGGALTITASQPGATLLVYTVAGKQFTVCRA